MRLQMQVDELQRVFRICPHCGASELCIERNHRIHCSACHFEYFHNVATAVGALVVTPQGLLLLERAKEPARGKYALPGGFVDPGESLEAALVRECGEEIGWFPENEELHYFCSFPNTYRYKDILYNTCDMFFLVKTNTLDPASLRIEPGEVTALKVLPLSDIQDDFLAFESTKQAVKLLQEI
ncbi:NUDIX domain-containing protein [Gracilinema caldarium]|uniref:NUDIX hydrolase n=1 Tax=Gracilinema caldarium TaxID=215591 RepID=UPI0026EA8FDE|nr:NUDIX domain-containing protein [Gracilinema caldarium]